jgi:hypothetical protein
MLDINKNCPVVEKLGIGAYIDLENIRIFEYSYNIKLCLLSQPAFSPLMLLIMALSWLNEVD